MMCLDLTENCRHLHGQMAAAWGEGSLCPVSLNRDSRRLGLRVQATSRVWVLLAAVLALFAGVFAAGGAGFAFVGAAFFAGFATSEGGCGEGGQGKEGQNGFHNVGDV